MSRRDDFGKVLRHQQPEKLIIDFGGNPLSSMEGKSQERLLEHLGFAPQKKAERQLFGKVNRIDDRILEHFDVDTRSIGSILKPKESQFEVISDNEYIDEWGIRRVFAGMYWDIVDYPLKGADINTLKSYHFPHPETIDHKEIEQYVAEAKRLYEETDYIICAEHPIYGVFELGCWLCSFDDFLLKMAIDEEFVHLLFEMILDYQKRVIDIYYGALGKYIHYTSSGDDYATQTSLFFSPEMFRKFISPYFKERISHTRKYTNAAYLHHSCGNVYPLIDDLIECGVNILNPIQPVSTEMLPQQLKKAFGGKIVFHGGVDTQKILPFGTRDEIEDYVKKTIDVLNKDGGYIFAAAHNIQEDVPPENLVYMLEAARKYGSRQLNQN